MLNLKTKPYDLEVKLSDIPEGIACLVRTSADADFLVRSRKGVWAIDNIGSVQLKADQYEVLSAVGTYRSGAGVAYDPDCYKLDKKSGLVKSLEEVEPWVACRDLDCAVRSILWKDNFDNVHVYSNKNGVGVYRKYFKPDRKINLQIVGKIDPKNPFEYV